MSPMKNYLAILTSSNGADEVTFVLDNAYSSQRCRTRKHLTSTAMPSPTQHEDSSGEETDTSSSCSSPDRFFPPPPQLAEEFQNMMPSKDLQRKANHSDGHENRSTIIPRILVAELEYEMARSSSNESLLQEQEPTHNDHPSLIDMIDEIQDVLSLTSDDLSSSSSSSSLKLDDSTWIPTTSAAVRPRTFGSNAA